MDEIRLLGFPLPPSINRAYKNVSNASGPGRAKTIEYRAFDRAVALWCVRNRKLVYDASVFVNQKLKGQALTIDYAFCFPHGRLITQKGLMKRCDVDNRIKIAADALGKILAFDDCLVGQGTYEKVALPSAREAFASFRLRWAPIRDAISWIDQP